MTKKVVDPIPVIVYRRTVDCPEDYRSIGYLIGSEGSDKRHRGSTTREISQGIRGLLRFSLLCPPKASADLEIASKRNVKEKKKKKEKERT